eukprot:SAG11_NODE_22141_length_411_cov_0.948718_1_plen_83_part_10
MCPPFVPADTESALYKHKQYLSQLQKDIRNHKAAEAGLEAENAEKRKKVSFTRNFTRKRHPHGNTCVIESRGDSGTLIAARGC